MTPTEQQAEAAWDIYLAARHKAEQSRRIEDGIAAGKAWGKFLELFTAEDQPSVVVPLRRFRP